MTTGKINVTGGSVLGTPCKMVSVKNFVRQVSFSLALLTVVGGSPRHPPTFSLDIEKENIYV